MHPLIAVPATAALVYRAKTHNSLTDGGIVAAIVTAMIHAWHPWNTPFVLLVVFFLTGSRVTKINADVKARLTTPARGGSGDPKPRGAMQVICNSGIASLLILAHSFQLRRRAALASGAGASSPADLWSAMTAPVLQSSSTMPTTSHQQQYQCFAWRGDLLPLGIVAHYAAAAADTFGSELGILSSAAPRLLTSATLRRVPPGTNGGVTLLGLAAGALGSLAIVASAMVSLPLCEPPPTMPPPPRGRGGGGGSGASGVTDATQSPFWSVGRRGGLMWCGVLAGVLGSLLDSVLGGLFQQTVLDVGSGRVVEGEGGGRVLVMDERHDARVRASLKAALLSHGPGSKKVEVLNSSGKIDESLKEKVIRRAKISKNCGDGETDGKGSGSRVVEEKHVHVGQRPSRKVVNGWDVLDNNQVNLLMITLVSLGAIVVGSWIWDVPLKSVLRV